MGQQPGLFLARKRWEGNLRTPCLITRNNVALTPQPTMSDGKPLRCTVRADKEVRIPGADPTQTQMRWVITFRHWHAAELPIRASDHITAQGYVYSVDTENAPQTDGVSTKVYAYALWSLDAMGNPGSPLYLRPNATVNVTRGGQPVSTSQHIRVMVAAPGPENINPEGVQVSSTILAAPGTSWHTGDIVTVEVLDGFTDLDQTTKSDVLSAGRQAGPLPTVRIFVRGTLQ